MANKKYIDFPSGTYDITKITLQADPTTGALEKVLNPVPGSFNSNVQLLAQTPGNNPTATAVYNSLPGTITWARTGTGAFVANASLPVFIAQKTIVVVWPSGEYGFWYLWTALTTTTLGMSKYNISGTQIDGLNNVLVEIRVYS